MSNDKTERKSRLIFEHVDRRGKVRLLPLSDTTQRLFAAGILNPQAEAGSDDGQARISSPQDMSSTLTAREWQVFDLLISGLSNKQMAYELSISPRTVEIHRARLMQKMGVRNTASLIRVAIRAAA